MEDYRVMAGTDTIGCVRIPAAFCGIFGFRPSHGAVSTIGVLPNAQSLDTIGKIHNFFCCHDFNQYLIISYVYQLLTFCIIFSCG